MKLVQFIAGDPVNDLRAFAGAIDGDPALKERVAAAESPEAVIQIAQAAGFTISLSQLKQAAPDLSASYWPWSGRGFRYRAQFFKNSRPPADAAT